MSSLKSFSNLRSLPVKRFFSQKSPSATPKKSDGINANVPGLSSYVIKQKSEPLGPGASSTGNLIQSALLFSTHKKINFLDTITFLF